MRLSAYNETNVIKLFIYVQHINTGTTIATQYFLYYITKHETKAHATSILITADSLTAFFYSK